MIGRIRAGFIFLCLLLLHASCELLQDQDPRDKKNVYYGPEIAIGKGTGRVWVKVAHEGKPTAMGVDLSAKALEGLPAETKMYHLRMPEAVRTQYKSVMLDWNPHGHEPTEIYGAPHFDYHFYLISNDERKAIPGGEQGHTEEFKKNYMPPTYFSTMMAVPEMGVHWIDAMSPEISGGKPFTRTFIYGSHQNNVIFYEPMVTVDYMKHLPAGKHQKVAVPQPPKVQKSGFYPLSYTITRTQNPGNYTVALTDLYYRKAN